MAHQLLARFKEDYAGEIQAGRFDSRDLARLEQNTRWLSQFLAHHNQSQPQALQMLVNTLRWRKDYGTNDIHEETLPEWINQVAGFYTRYKAKDGTSIWWLHTDKGDKERGVRESDNVKRYYVWSMEQSFRVDPAIRHTCIIDFTHGVHFPDRKVLELGKFIVSVSSNYYANITRSTVVIGMPKFFVFAFKLMRTFGTPQDLGELIFCTPEEVAQYVDPEYLPPYLGGTNETIREFVPWEKVRDVTVADPDDKRTSLKYPPHSPRRPPRASEVSII